MLEVRLGRFITVAGLYYVVSVAALGLLVFRIVDGTGMFEGRKPWGVLCCQC